MDPMRIAYFVSGNGSTFQYLAERLKRERTDAVSALLLSSNKKALALDRAAKLGIPAEAVRERDFATTAEFTDALLAVLHTHKIGFICLAGYMKLVPKEVVNEYDGRIINVHPALLPAFGGQGMYGRRVHEAVIASQAKVSGATIHLVDCEYDRGPIVAQQALCIRPNDTAESLETRVHAMEVQLYYNTLLLFIQNRVKITDHRATILPPLPND